MDMVGLHGLFDGIEQFKSKPLHRYILAGSLSELYQSLLGVVFMPVEAPVDVILNPTPQG